MTTKRSDILLASIREGRSMTMAERLDLIVRLSIPSILSQAATVLMFYIDAAMVGHLGAEASAAIGLVDTTTWLFTGLTTAFALGFSVQTAHCIGANDLERARQVFRHGLICTTIASMAMLLVCVAIHRELPYLLGGNSDIAHDASTYFLVFSLALPMFQLSNTCGTVLKSSGDMRIPSIVNAAMCLVDVAMNYLFIYVVGLGVLGAALGTAIAITSAAAAQAYFAIVRSKMLSLCRSGERLLWSWHSVRNAAWVSSPLALQTALTCGAHIVSTVIVAPLGNFAIAANTFAITAESLCYMPGYGIGEAATTLVGQSVGAGRYDLSRSLARLTVYLGMAVMTFMGILMYIFAPEMIGMLSPVEEIRLLGTQSLRIEAFAEPMFAAAIVTYNVGVGAGDSIRPALFNFLSMWCVRLTLAALLAPRYGLLGVWAAMATELTLRGIVFLVYLWNGSWLKRRWKAL